jgi:hypothetical protein
MPRHSFQDLIRTLGYVPSVPSFLGSLKVSSLDQVDNLKTLQEIVVALEDRAAQPKQ